MFVVSCQRGKYFKSKRGLRGEGVGGKFMGGTGYIYLRSLLAHHGPFSGLFSFCRDHVILGMRNNKKRNKIRWAWTVDLNVS